MELGTGYAGVMRRRRLALRQIEEARPDVSDLEDEEDEEERLPPTFSLLAPAKAPDVAAPVIVASVRADQDAAGEEDGSGTQPMSPLLMVTRPKESSDIVDGKPAIFQLYQQGFTPDQVLQLAFVRRRVSVLTYTISLV